MIKKALYLIGKFLIFVFRYFVNLIIPITLLYIFYLISSNVLQTQQVTQYLTDTNNTFYSKYISSCCNILFAIFIFRILRNFKRLYEKEMSRIDWVLHSVEAIFSYCTSIVILKTVNISSQSNLLWASIKGLININISSLLNGMFKIGDKLVSFTLVIAKIVNVGFLLVLVILFVLFIYANKRLTLINLKEMFLTNLKGFMGVCDNDYVIVDNQKVNMNISEAVQIAFVNKENMVICYDTFFSLILVTKQHGQNIIVGPYNGYELYELVEITISEIEASYKNKTKIIVGNKNIIGTSLLFFYWKIAKMFIRNIASIVKGHVKQDKNIVGGHN